MTDGAPACASSTTRWARSPCPADALWGAQTQRAVQNFEISGEPLSRDLIGALASIKGAAAIVNGELGVLPADLARAIHDAAADVARGQYDDQFPIDVFQTGSGTSSNMNANEVIATLASPRRWAGRSTRMITSTRPSRPTTCSRPRSTWRRSG